MTDAFAAALGTMRPAPALSMLLAALALGACSVGGPLPAPAGLVPVPPAAFAGAMRDAVFADAQGAPLAASVWTPEAPPRAVILALHGFGDYGPSTFGEAAERWAQSGILVYAYDQRGFGRNASRGWWPGQDALVSDFAAVAAQIAAAHPGLPLTAVGHSMGAAVLLAGLGEGRAPDVDRAVLAGAAIAGGDALNPLARAGVWTVAAVAPDLRWSGGDVVAFKASDDIALLRRLAADPLYLGRPSAREVLGLFRLMDRAAAAAPGAATPVLALHGARDEVVEPAPAREAAAAIPGLTEFRVYAEGWHLLFGDLQKARVWDDVAAFALEGPET